MGAGGLISSSEVGSSAFALVVVVTVCVLLLSGLG